MIRGLGGYSPSNVAHNLRGVDFPAHKKSLFDQARKNGAESKVLEVLESIPDTEYQDMAEVMKGIGEGQRVARPGDD